MNRKLFVVFAVATLLVLTVACAPTPETVYLVVPNGAQFESSDPDSLPVEIKQGECLDLEIGEICNTTEGEYSGLYDQDWRWNFTINEVEYEIPNQAGVTIDTHSISPLASINADPESLFYHAIAPSVKIDQVPTPTVTPIYRVGTVFTPIEIKQGECLDLEEIGEICNTTDGVFSADSQWDWTFTVNEESYETKFGMPIGDDNKWFISVGVSPMSDQESIFIVRH